jgi:hypothetical protein
LSGRGCRSPNALVSRNALLVTATFPSFSCRKRGQRADDQVRFVVSFSPMTACLPHAPGRSVIEVKWPWRGLPERYFPGRALRVVGQRQGSRAGIAEASQSFDVNAKPWWPGIRSIGNGISRPTSRGRRGRATTCSRPIPFSSPVGRRRMTLVPPVPSPCANAIASRMIAASTLGKWHAGGRRSFVRPGQSGIDHVS